MNRYERLNEERKIIEKRKRVAAYCRVSTDNEDQANSFESQQRYFKQYIERNPDWELYEIFADEGISGTSTKKRKEFNRMIACAKNGDFDLIITKEISRFARNTLDSIYYTRDLKKHGVGVIFMNDNINTLDGDAELRLAIMSSIAQEESRKTSERVKWGQKRQMEQGVVFGRSMLGYDVKDGKMTINEEGAKIVRLIFHKFMNEGKGTHVIARELREEGIEPMRVKEWQNTVILRVIRNEKYCGDLLQKKYRTTDYLTHRKVPNDGTEAQFCLRDHHEAIVSRTQFEAVQAELARRAGLAADKGRFSARYWYSGKIRCGACGKSFTLKRTRRADGTEYQRFVCRGRLEGGHACRMRAVPAQDLLACARGVLRAIGLDGRAVTEELVRALERPQPDAAGGAEPIRRALQRRTERKERALEAFLDGDLAGGDMRRMVERYEEEMKQLQEQLERLEQQGADAEETGAERRARVAELAERELAGSDAVLDEAIRRITVYPEQLLVEVTELPVVFRVCTGGGVPAGDGPPQDTACK